MFLFLAPQFNFFNYIFFLVFTTQFVLATCYQVKGELNIALEFYNKILAQIPRVEHYFPMRFLAMTLKNIGNIYYRKRELDTALKNYINSLEINKRIIAGSWMSHTFFNIIEVLVGKGNRDESLECLRQFKRFTEEHTNKPFYEESYSFYQLSCALFLNSSSRMHDRVEAENRLKKIIVKHQGNKFFVGIINIAIIMLCEWYFDEFRFSINYIKTQNFKIRTLY